MGLHLADLALYRSSSQRHGLVTLPSGVTGDKSRFHLRALVAGVSGQTEPTKLAGLLTSYSHVARLFSSARFGIRLGTVPSGGRLDTIGKYQRTP
jgi:hypothetical protein